MREQSTSQISINFHTFLIILTLIGVIFSGSELCFADDWNQEIVDLIKNARPSIVIVEAKSPISARLGPLGDIIAAQQNREGLPKKWYKSVATGVVWTSDGYIVTTSSVIKDAVEYSIIFCSDKTYSAKLVASDKQMNLAILKCDLEPDETFNTISKRKDELPEGSWVVMLGYGFGGIPTVAPGMAGMPPQQQNPTRSWFQFTAPIRPGNSGSALIDSDGNLAGIVLGKEKETGFQAILQKMKQHAPGLPQSNQIQQQTQFSNSGIAIPISTASHLINQLITNGYILRGWLGVGVQSVRCSLENQTFCLKVQRVVKNSPASNAGIQIGDCLIAFGSHTLHTPGEFGNLVASTIPGSTATVKFLRDNEIIKKEVKIQARPD